HHARHRARASRRPVRVDDRLRRGRHGPRHGRGARMKPALSLVHEDGFAIVTVDLPGEPVNKVTAALRAEFGELFGRIESDPTVRGVILMSGKPDTWIAGADID